MAPNFGQGPRPWVAGARAGSPPPPYSSRPATPKQQQQQQQPPPSYPRRLRAEERTLLLPVRHGQPVFVREGVRIRPSTVVSFTGACVLTLVLGSFFLIGQGNVSPPPPRYSVAIIGKLTRSRSIPLATKPTAIDAGREGWAGIGS